ncbi:hypothetical protein MMMDOFMJ_0365 [Methylobacterium gnaphalii]|nr:hypothetical protein MMMDOFMJ_0365 [Methylobacterium gnaphalii]
MHFVAMLAFSMPGMEASYDPSLTALIFPCWLSGASLRVMSAISACFSMEETAGGDLYTSMIERILFAKPSTAKGLVIICMPGSR